MSKDYALDPNRDKAKTQADIEAEILAAERQTTVTTTLEREDNPMIDRADRKNFAIRAGSKLPEKFINPPAGSPGHLCVDQGGIYRPDWFSIKIFKQHPGQRDPQPFPLGARWRVPLSRWTDVPPEVVESLRSAVETRHEMNFTPGDIELGRETQHTTTEIPRFFWDHKPSA